MSRAIIHLDADALFEQLGLNGERWIQGKWGGVTRDDKKCLHGAIRLCQPVPGDAYLVEEVAARQDWGIDWNDDDDTEWSDVKAKVNGGIDVTDADLEETFGPQWREIVALVRRAAVLTDAERGGFQPYWLARYWPAAIAADIAAAANSATYAVDSATTATAVDSATTATAAAVARWAAHALAVRHLIGQHGFTQEHYNTLTRAWRKAIGPIHAEDDDE